MKNSSEITQEFLRKGACQTCPVIDMHGHYGAFHGIYFPNPWAAGMLQMMDRSGVACIVCSSHASLADQARGNLEMAAVIRDHPGRFYGYRTINPNYPEDAAREIERFAEDPGFVGLKFHPSGHSYRLTGARYGPALEYANQHRLLVLTHSWGSSDYDRPDLVREVAQQYPEATFLMGHSGYGDWETAISVARECGNVYLELTAVVRVSGIITRMVREAGSERVVFGSDLPWFDQHYGIGSVCFSRIDDEDRRNILYRNARRLLAPWRAS